MELVVVGTLSRTKTYNKRQRTPCLLVDGVATPKYSDFLYIVFVSLWSVKNLLVTPTEVQADPCKIPVFLPMCRASARNAKHHAAIVLSRDVLTKHSNALQQGNWF